MSVKNSDFVTDMAIDALERQSLAKIAVEKTLSHGIVRRVVNLKNAELAKKTGRERGVYVTFDCPSAALEQRKAVEALQNHIANTLVECVGIMGRKSLVLTVGLGNDDIAADSLGCEVISRLRVSATEEAKRTRQKARLAAFATGVEGVTGIKTVDTVEGICEKLKPSCVILVDALATSSATRLGTSFQLTTAGIAPASGVGGDKPRIDRSTLGVPVVAVGVPLVLSMRTVLREFAEDYLKTVQCEGNEYKLRELMVEKRLTRLVVAPKEIKYYVACAAEIVAGAINLAFGE